MSAKDEIEAAREIVAAGTFVLDLIKLYEAAEKDKSAYAAFGGLRYIEACGRAKALIDVIMLARLSFGRSS